MNYSRDFLSITTKYLPFWIMCCVLLLSLTQCDKSNNKNPKEKLQGTWSEDAELVPFASQVRKSLTFQCDSFHTVFLRMNDVGDGEDCQQSVWKEYAKGVYSLNNKTIQFVGVFTDSTGQPKLTGCYRTGKYKEEMDIFFNTKNVMNLIKEFKNSNFTQLDTFRFNKVHSVKCNNWPEGN